MVVPNINRTVEEEARLVSSPRVAFSGPTQSGKVGWALLWLLGVPLPVLLVVYLIFHH
jgi:hypothetical protein